jgi:hypothetical protein
VFTLIFGFSIIGLWTSTAAGIAAGIAPWSLALPAAVFARRLGWSPASAAIAPLLYPVLFFAVVNSAVVTLRQGGVRWRGTFYSLDTLRRGNAVNVLQAAVQTAIKDVKSRLGVELVLVSCFAESESTRKLRMRFDLPNLQNVSLLVSGNQERPLKRVTCLPFHNVTPKIVIRCLDAALIACDACDTHQSSA